MHQTASASVDAAGFRPSEYLVELSGAVVAEVDEQSTVRLDQVVSLWSARVAHKPVSGQLERLLFIHPLLGVVKGAMAGALTQTLAEIGTDECFVKVLLWLILPDQAQRKYSSVKESHPDSRLIVTYRLRRCRTGRNAEDYGKIMSILNSVGEPPPTRSEASLMQKRHIPRDGTHR